MNHFAEAHVRNMEHRLSLIQGWANQLHKQPRSEITRSQVAETLHCFLRSKPEKSRYQQDEQECVCSETSSRNCPTHQVGG